jgi:hypothetical protein
MLTCMSIMNMRFNQLYSEPEDNRVSSKCLGHVRLLQLIDDAICRSLVVMILLFFIVLRLFSVSNRALQLDNPT